MEAIDHNAFVDWCAGKSLTFAPDHEQLKFLTPSEHARFWVLPDDPAPWPHFAASVLIGLDPWKQGYLVPQSGHWPAAARTLTFKEKVRQIVLRGAGVPDNWHGAIRYETSEQSEIVAIMFAYFAFGGSAQDDLYFVPDHAAQIVQTDHHDVVHVECQTEQRMLDFVRHMAEKRYDLPTEVPDWTFIRPVWMK